MGDGNGDGELSADGDESTAAYENLKVPSDFLATPPEVERLFRDAFSHHPLIGQRIGPYEVKRWLGGGGFGHVYLAFRSDDYKQKVAVKVLRSDIEVDDRVLARFELERQLLADLQHDHIARLLYGGTLDTGRPYIVMEYVKGKPITEYCDSKRLPVKERLALFRQVCEAVAYAHRFGAIHRDIKPKNVFVDEDENVKLLDFGIAKMVDPLSKRRALTISEGGAPMTPEYASPEQIRGRRGEGISTASDVYALGVVLYELLTGRRPYDLSNCTAAECERIICEREPQKPSTIVLEPVRVRRDDGTDDVHSAESLAAPRSADPQTLNRLLKGDLEQIVLMALRKEPQQRYPNVEVFIQDLQRFSCGQTIVARPIGHIGRASRWAKRKPMMATTIGLVLFLAFAGPIAALREVHLRRLLEERFTERNNLISEKEHEMRLAASKIADLGVQLDLWEGRANPWEFWPPKRDEPLRQNLVIDLLKHSKATLINQLRSGKYTGEETARGYLGLAMMADVMAQNEFARECYVLARDQLFALHQRNPQNPQLSRALAACYLHLARLATDSDRDQATKDLHKARAIYQQLAAERKSDPTYQIDWLESEWTSSRLEGFNSAHEQLARVAKIKSTLAAKWPEDPNSLYQVACYLTQAEPILAESPPAQAHGSQNATIKAPSD